MTFQDTYERLLLIGEFDGKYPDLLKKYTKLVKKHTGISKVIGLALGRNRHTVRLDLEGWTLFVYVNGALVLYRGDWDGKAKPERTFDSFEEVKKYLEEQV